MRGLLGGVLGFLLALAFIFAGNFGLLGGVLGFLLALAFIFAGNFLATLTHK
ncbi:MAG: hypothetical protein HYU24_11750 [Candidatus Rokubacteria bacterium]|nr:hypothetical protein [Candidatus Rokubacteria bacterium]